MKIHIDIRDDIPPNIALRCVTQVVEEGRVSANGKMYAYATTFVTCLGEIWVAARPYRKSDCFLVYKKSNTTTSKMTRHNNDIAACGHATCPSRRTCLRWIIGQRMEDYQWFGEFKPKDGVCAYHIWTSEKLDDNEKD